MKATIRGKGLSEGTTRVAEAVSLCLLLASSPLSRSAILIHSSISGFFPFVVAQMAAVIATSIVLCARRWDGARSPLAALLLCVALHAAGGACLFVAGCTHVPEAVLVAFGVGSGAGAVPMAVFLIRRLAKEDLGGNLLGAALALGAAATLCWLTASVPSPGSGALSLALLALGSIGCAIGALLDERRRLGSSATPPDGTGFVTRIRSADMLKLASIAGVPLFGAFAFAVFVKPIASPGYARPSIFGFDEELLLFLAAAAIAAVMGASFPKKPLLPITYQVTVPVAVCFVLTLLSFPRSSGVYQVASALMVLVTAFALVSAVAVICTVSGSGEVPAACAVCSLLSVYALGRTCGIALHFVIAALESKYDAYQVVATAILSAMMLFTLYQSLRKESRQNPGLAATIPSMVEGSCNRLGQEHGLTARESDVLKILARGYSPAYVADVLVIAESTARTHAHNIYRKLGVSTREELFALVDRTCPAQSDQPDSASAAE